MATAIVASNVVSVDSVGSSVTNTNTKTYASCLNNNLNIPHVVNPTYICQQPFTQCGHTLNLQEKQKCESFWSDVCQKK
jgi:hypothetical protein